LQVNISFIWFPQVQRLIIVLQVNISFIWCPVNSQQLFASSTSASRSQDTLCSFVDLCSSVNSTIGRVCQTYTCLPSRFVSDALGILPLPHPTLVFLAKVTFPIVVSLSICFPSPVVLLSLT